MKRLTTLVSIILYLTSLSSEIVRVPLDYITIQEGINHCSSGDTLEIYQGLYSEGEISLGNKGLNIVGVYQTKSDSTQYFDITIKDTSFFGEDLESELYIENLSFENSSGDRDMVDIDGSSHTVTIKDCNFSEYSHGVNIDAQNAHILNNQFYGTMDGVTLKLSALQDSSSIIGNSFYGELERGISVEGGRVNLVDNSFNGPITAVKLLGGEEYLYSVIRNNFTATGTGLESDNCNFTAINNIFKENNIGVEINRDQDLDDINLSNNIFYSNEVAIKDSDGDNGKLNLISNTIANNGTAITSENIDIDIFNTIIWDNDLSFGGASDGISAYYSSISSSDAQLINHNNCFIGDPQFSNIDTLGYELAENSPCIDSGTPDISNLIIPNYDLKGNSRVMGGRIDIGAFEFFSNDTTSTDTLNYYWSGDITLEETFEVPEGGVLNIEPGTDIRVNNLKSIVVKGAIIAIGSDENPITFQSLLDSARWNGFIFPAKEVADTTLIITSQFEDCIIRDCGGENGGGFQIHAGNKVLFTDCEFDDNEVDGFGGAGYIVGSDVEFRNCVFTNNIALMGGGALYLEESNSKFYNNNIVYNSADETGGGLHLKNASPQFYSSIIYDNSAAQGNQVYLEGNSYPHFYYCNIMGGPDGFYGDGYTLEGCISSDPQFTQVGNFLYGLSSNSPCIDSGVASTDSLYLPDLDYLGNIRVSGGRVDIGVVESQRSEVQTLSKSASFIENYPNPFNPTTTIKFGLDIGGTIAISIYNCKGQIVKRVVKNNLKAGIHSLTFDGSNLNSGIYFYQLRMDGKVLGVNRMMILK